MSNVDDVNIIGTGRVKFGLEYRDLLSDQGVCINAVSYTHLTLPTTPYV